MGTIIGTGVGTNLAGHALGCDRWNSHVRSTLASFLAGGAALLVSKADTRAGEWTAIVGMPLTSAYFVGGCSAR